MKASAKKSTTTSKTVSNAANQPFFAKTGGGNFFSSVNRAPAVQAKMRVNKPGDKFEQEADKMAGKVMRMPTPASPAPETKVQRQEEEKLQKQDDKEIQKSELPEEQVQKQEKKKIQKAELPEEQVQKQEKEEIQKAELPEEQVQKQEKEKIQKAELPEEQVQKQEKEKIQKTEEPEEQVQKQEDEEVQRKDNGTPAIKPGTQSVIRSKTTGGQPLSGDVRSFMEPRFNADFSNVRVHSDAEAAGLSSQLSARAFTYQNHIFFSRDQYQPGTSEGKELLAHELTHTLQQGASQRKTPQKTHENHTAKQYKAPAAPAPVADIKPTKINKPQEPSPLNNLVDKTPPVELPPLKTEGRGDTAGTDNPALARPPIDENPDADDVPVEPTVAEKVTVQRRELIQRQAGDCPPPEPVPEVSVVPSPASPAEDPAFQQMNQRVNNRAASQASHGSGQDKSVSANAAAEVKEGEKQIHGQKDQVEKIDAQAKQPPVFDKKAFVDKVLEEALKIAPKTLDDFTKFAQRNKPQEVKTAVTGQVKQSQEKSTGPLDQTAKESPGPGQSPRTAMSLNIESPGQQPGSIRADRAMPPPKTDSEIDFQADTVRAENILKEACVTPCYMNKYNDPELKAGAKAQETLKQTTTEAPEQYRAEEAATLVGARGGASAQGKQSVNEMFGERAEQFEQVGSKQEKTKTDNEVKREAAAKEIDEIFTSTKTKVEDRLKQIDTDVAETFDREATAASQKFQNVVDQKAKSLKKSWYESLIDFFDPPPKEAKDAYESGRQAFVNDLTAVIGKIADIVEKGLEDARQIVEQGKADVQAKLESLGSELDDFKQQQAEKMNDRFRGLEGTIKNKQSGIIKGLAVRYVKTLKEAKKAEQRIRDKYKNVFDHAKDAYNAVKDAVLGWIEKLSAVVGGAAKRIIRDPGTFLSNLGAGIVQGLSMFIGNIGENIKGAVVQWLTGSMGSAGISLPKSFDVRGIIGFLLELVGLGVTNIKNIARKVFGHRVVSLIEKGVAGAEKIKQIFDILLSEGPAGLFKYLAGEFERMKGKVMGEVGKALAQGLAVAGIKKVMGIIAGLATGGAGSVVTIVMTIIDVALWFVNNAAQLAEIASKISSMALAILQGQVGAIAGAINDLLKRMLPTVLSFLGSLIGIGGVVSKIQKIFKAIRKPATKAITSLFKGMKGLVKKLIAKVGKKLGRGKGKGKDKKKDKNKLLSPRKVKGLVFAAMAKPTRAKEPAAALAEKQAQAQSLIGKYQPKLKKGRLKIKITDRSAKDVEKDAAVDFVVSASSGKKGEAKVPIDRNKEKKKIVKLVLQAMRRTTKAKEPAAALAEKQAQAQSLIAKYQPKLKKGRLKINITDRSAKDVEKDAAVDFAVSASPKVYSKAKLAEPSYKILALKLKMELEKTIYLPQQKNGGLGANAREQFGKTRSKVVPRYEGKRKKIRVSEITIKNQRANSKKPNEKWLTFNITINNKAKTKGKAEITQKRDTDKAIKEIIKKISKLKSDLVDARYYYNGKIPAECRSEHTIRNYERIRPRGDFNLCWQCKGKDQRGQSYGEDHMPPTNLKVKRTQKYGPIYIGISKHCAAHAKKQAGIVTNLNLLSNETIPKLKAIKTQVYFSPKSPGKVDELKKARAQLARAERRKKRYLSSMYIRGTRYHAGEQLRNHRCAYCAINGEIIKDYIADHWPPNSLLEPHFWIRGDTPPQYFKPHCPSHSNAQSGKTRPFINTMTKIKNEVQDKRVRRELVIGKNK